jgi:hypothetical protein
MIDDRGRLAHAGRREQFLQAFATDVEWQITDIQFVAHRTHSLSVGSPLRPWLKIESKSLDPGAAPLRLTANDTTCHRRALPECGVREALGSLQTRRVLAPDSQYD